MGRDESGTVMRLLEHLNLRLAPAVARRGGRVIRLKGDGGLIEFASAVDALAAAIDFQQVMVEANGDQPDDKAIVFRIGLHLGDVIVEGDDIYGDDVNVAARLEAEAPPGGIVVSRAVRDAVQGRLKATLHALGELTLKNIDRPIRAFRVEWAVEDWPAPSVASGAPASPMGRAPALMLPDKPSIAVLPFQNMSGDPEQEYFVDGLVEEIITALSRFKALFVIARNSTFTYKGKAVDIKQVGRELGVRYVLEGSVRKAANRLRISGQLIEASTGGHLWADHFDGVLEDVFELQDQVTASVVGAIAPKLEQAEIERAMHKPTESLDAYDCFLRGMAHYHLFTKDSLLEARRLFRRATDLDPTYAAAYGFGVWCIIVCQTNNWLADPQHDVAEGVRLARRAVAAGMDDPIALVSGGTGLAYLAGELESGIAYVDRAIVLNPNLALAWSVSGWGRSYLGDHADAIVRLERAIRLSPLDLLAYHFYTGMGWAHLFAGHYDEASSWARKAALENPQWASTARVEAIAFALSGKIVEAREALARMLAITPNVRLSRKWRPYGDAQKIAPCTSWVLGGRDYPNDRAAPPCRHRVR